jgi:sphinganine-1-phosphate aldolase
VTFTQWLDIFQKILLVLFILRYTRKTWIQLRGYGVVGSIQNLYRDVYRRLYALFLRLPFVQAKVQAQVQKSIDELQGKLVPSGPGVTQHTSLPATGWTAEQVHAELQKLGEMKHTSWEKGRVSGAVYHGGDELLNLQGEAFRKFGVSNPIHPDVFPGVRKMEAEVVAMVLGLFNAPEGGAGVTTSGGTESIIMSVLAAKGIP